MAHWRSNHSLYIAVLILTLTATSVIAPVLASAVNFYEWRATSSQSQDTSAFYYGDTVYASVKIFNGLGERVKIKAAFYRIDPDAFQTFLGENEQEIEPGNTSELLMEIWAIPANPACGYYNYSINYHVYRTSTGELLEQGETPWHTLYRIESGVRPATLRIQFLNASYLPVSSASVYIDGNFKGYTNAYGYYMINISPVTHTIRIQKEGYNEVTETIYDIKQGQINEVKIYHMAPQAPYSTEPSDVITEGSTTFRWEISPTANLYRIQVSTTNDFSKKVLDTSSHSNCYSTILSGGFYYWRVRAVNDFNQSPWSYVRSMRILYREVNVHFYTNPSSAYITFSGSDNSNGTVAIYPRGSYSIKANPPLGYTFYNWITSGNISISNLNSPSTSAEITGGGTCTITANFKQQESGDVPVLFVTNAPEVSINRGEETAFPVNLTNDGKYCIAELWFKSLPEGVMITDDGGLKTIDSGATASFNVKVKVNQTVRAGNYICQVAGDSKNATHNWQPIILRVASASQPSNIIPNYTATPNPTPTPTPEAAPQPAATALNRSTVTPSTPVRSMQCFEVIFGIIATIAVICIIRRKA